MIKLQAHRGSNRHYPENTLPAYYGAIREGYTYIELDTKFTKDNKCILLHDRNVNRTGRYADGSKIEEPLKAEDMTLEEIRELDFGVHFSEEFKGTKVPTLDELMDFVRETKMPVKFDNVIQTAADAQLDIFFAALEESGVEELTGVCSNDVDFVRRVTERLKKCKIYYDGPTSKDIYERLIRAADGHVLSIWLPSEKKSWLPYPPATEADVALARQYGEVGLWTAHDAQSLAYIIKLSPDVMELDGEIHPEDVRKAEANHNM